jgi:hypothetical protein
MEAVILIVVVVGIAGAVWGVRRYLDQKRTLALEALAPSLGLSFEPDASQSPLLLAWKDFELMKRGHSQKAWNLMQGEGTGVEVALFDYQYISGHGRNARRRAQTVAYLRSNRLRAPFFALAPEGFFSIMGQSLWKRQDIDFEKFPEFSKIYELQGPLEDPLRKYFTPARLAFFEAHPGWHVEMKAGYMLAYCEDLTQPVGEMENFLKEVLAMFQVLAE